MCRGVLSREPGLTKTIMYKGVGERIDQGGETMAPARR